MASDDVSIRRAQLRDLPELTSLVEASLCQLATPYYTREQIGSALEWLLALDPQLVLDGTYFVAELDGVPAGCGGWSFRGEAMTSHGLEPRPPVPLRDPGVDPAAIRAVFTHPAFARRGIGRRLVEHAETCAGRAGFGRFELIATLSGQPLYQALGYRATATVELALPDGTVLNGVHMLKGVAARRPTIHPRSALRLHEPPRLHLMAS